MYARAHVLCMRRKKDFWKFVWQHACFHSLGRVTVWRKKRKHCNFTFGQNPAFRSKGVSEPVLEMEPCIPGTLSFTLLYLIVEYLIGWCVSISHKSFSGRKNHVRTDEKARLIRTFVNNDPMKSHRRCGAPWAAWASLLPSCWKMTQGRCTNCTILLQKDVSPVYAATVTIKWLRSGSGSGSSPEAPPSRGHRGLRTLPHQFSSYGVMWRKRPTSVNPETSQS